MEQIQKTTRDNWKSLFATLKALKLPWLWIALALALNLILNTMMLEMPDITADLLSGVLTGAALGKAILYYVVLGLMSFIMVAGQVQAQALGVRCARSTLWKKMLGMKMEYFDSHDPSDLMSAVIHDANSAVNDLVNCIIYLIPDIYYVVAALLRIREYHWILALSCFAILPLKYIYALVMGRQFQAGTARLYGRVGALTSFLADRIHHLTLVKAYTNEKEEIRRGEETARELLQANMKLVQLDNISVGASAVLEILQKFIVVVIAVVLLQQKKIDIAMWLAFFLFTQNLFPTMDGIFDQWIRLKSIHGGFHRITEIMQGPEECTSGEPLPEDGEISFDHVTFSYPGTDKPALQDVSFSIPQGSGVAIVGLCGSGKTTSVSLIARFYQPTSGSITIGGRNIQEISLEEFRKNFSYVQQGASVFGGTVREAVTYGIDRAISDGEILTAAKRTGFYEYLAQCPEGLDTPVSADGSSMSGGQSQRLVVTREILRNGKIVLMDEPTSALDVRVSETLQESMDALFADKTRILITHDLNLAKRYSRILVLENGRLVGDGSHEALLADCKPYQALYRNAKEAAV